MGLFSGIRKVTSKAFNVRAWVDYDRVKESSKGLGQLIKSLFITERAQYSETFEQAMQRLHLTEKDIQAKQREFLVLSTIMLVITLAVVAYFIYHLASLHIFGAIVSVAAMAVSASMAFRYHFYYFQTKQRKLGCTLKEWFIQGLLGRKS